MIRTLTVLATLAAIAGPACASELKVSLVGKDAATIKSDITTAAKAVCAKDILLEGHMSLSPMVSEVNACVEQTIKATYAKIDRAQLAMLSGSKESLR